MAGRTELVYNSQLDPLSAFTYFKNMIQDAENRVIFSRALQEARKGLNVSLHVMDIDSLVMQYLRDKKGHVVGRRILGAFELKNKSEHTVKGSELLVNGKQYKNLYWFSKTTGISVFYIVKVGKEFYLWNVERTRANFEWRGQGYSHDYYAILEKDDLIKARHEELGGILRLLLFDGR